MDAYAFDGIAKSLATARSRRRALRLLAASALAPLVNARGTNAKGKKKKDRCRPNWESCTMGGKACCSGADHCCLPYDPHGLGEDGPYCTSKNAFCCSAEAGGGGCGIDEICCKTTPRYRGVNDYCEKIGGECCNDPIGGSCAPGFSCCVDPTASPQYTCCANPARSQGGVNAGTARAGRNFQLRTGSLRA